MRLLFFRRKQVIAQLELRLDVIARLLVGSQVSQGYGVLVAQLVLQLTAHRRQHRVVFAQIVTVAVLLIYREVRHARVGETQQVAVVLIVLGVSERNVGFNLDAVADEVVQIHTRAETVQLLFDDGTRLMVITHTDTEMGFLTATAQG